MLAYDKNDSEVWKQRIREGFCPKHECDMSCTYIGGTREFLDSHKGC